MHHKEYFSAGDDAKLLLAQLPEASAELFIFGKTGDWDRFKVELARVRSDKQRQPNVAIS